MVNKPTFAHKICASMKIKDTEQGLYREDYGLIYDPSIGEFILVPIIDRQTQILLEDEEES